MKDKRLILGSLLVVMLIAIPLVALAIVSPPAEAGNKQTIKILPAGGTNASGTIKITQDESGPDKMKLRIKGLAPHSRHTVFLTFHQSPGGLPAQFIGEFKADKKGKAKMDLVLEVVDAFASHNLDREISDGSPDGRIIGRIGGIGADTLPPDGTANTSPLNFFRGYKLPENGGINIFGNSESVPGSGPSFITEEIQ